MAEASQQYGQGDDQLGTSKAAAVAERQRLTRMRTYAIESIRIGTFFVDLSSPQSTCTNKLRFYFTQEQIIYDFEFEFWINPDGPSRFLGAICVPFNTVTGVCCQSKDIYIFVSHPPRLVIGSNGLHPVPPPIGIDITNGQLDEQACHKVVLTRAQGYLVQQVLRDSNALSSKILEDLPAESAAFPRFVATNYESSSTSSSYNDHMLREPEEGGSDSIGTGVYEETDPGDLFEGN